MSTTRRLGPLVLALAVAAVASFDAAAVAQPSHESGQQSDHRRLRILVTNDDGWIGPGGSSTPLIAALRDALVADGHQVTVVAPATNQSGTGTLITYPTVNLANPEPGVWTVTGTPSDAVIVGLDALFRSEPPDLVVSGINPGGNYSSIVNHSGTVGAATMALENDVPAIAVSIDGKTREQSVALKDQVAEYTSDVVAALARRARDGAVLPAGLGLNINYPGTAAARGTSLTHVDPNSYLRFGFTNTTGAPGQPGTYALTLGGPTGTPEPGSDWSALQADKVSITPIDADLSANPRDVARVQFLERVAP
ncbi:5'/3'-nucleotidase SurE [Micromonospora halophytica]|uniref:5'-nucleotidase n=1 Tax=Micromonospora halophytica TaxID=47864 RepID=A0A1C5GQ22_9ACTN|nr:5'/3'-nucleotidase SurE [Micromonospora halophytica]SCG35647.1 5'-nucleotidase /3'-nucleotidase /exopolyphosphatase [Micromonospora halophytica]